MASWNVLCESLGERLFNKISHDYGRKRDSWESNGTVVLKASEAEELDIYVVPDGVVPMCELPEAYQDSIFIAQVGKRRFLVNTEGYSYCRYIAKLRIVKG